MHVTLPEGKIAEVGIVNIFAPGTGEPIVFDTTAFEVETARVGGRPVNFAQWLRERQIDTRLPLVADYSGEMINVSFQQVDEGLVKFYAPVVKGVEYRLAQPINDYRGSLRRALSERPIEPLFGCNCILNYLYGQLEGQAGIPIPGPATFGEIAFILLNQTLVYVTVCDQRVPS